MTELFAISPQANVLSAAAVVSAPRTAAPSRATDVSHPEQVSPESTRNVTPETVAAIQALGGRDSDAESEANAETTPAAVEPKTYEQLQAEARRWERYYAHQPRRLADLLAVYYGDHPGSPAHGIEPVGGESDDDRDEAASS